MKEDSFNKQLLKGRTRGLDIHRGPDSTVPFVPGIHSLFEFPVFRVAFAIVIPFAVLTGCTEENIAKKSSLSVDETDRFTRIGGSEQISDRWWEAFQDRALNRVVEQALEENFDLRSSWHRVKSAAALADQQSSYFWPQLEGSVGLESLRPRGEEPTEDTTLQPGLSATYELDLWGRIDANYEAEKSRYRATEMDYRTAALTLSAEVVRTWFSLVRASQETELLNEQVETNRKILGLMKSRYATGSVKRADLLRQMQLIETTENRRVLVARELDLLQNQLQVLLGRVPGQQDLLPRDHQWPEQFPEMPAFPETGVPLETLQRRPDVKSAYHRLEAADHELAAAISARFPRLTLGASTYNRMSDPENMTERWALSLSGNLLVPLFYGGRLQAAVRQKEHTVKEQLFLYNQVLLNAYREVEQAIVRENRQRQRLASLKKQLDLSERTYRQLRLEYLNGVVSYLDVLTSLIDQQKIERDLIYARRELMEYRVALYRALAGGFTVERQAP